MNKNKKIGIVLLATNAYFVLGLRFIRRWDYFYEGSADIKFYFFSDKDPKSYLPSHINIEFHPTSHSNWRDGTNSKFSNILKLKNCTSDDEYLFYFDADTNIQKPFTEDWFIGELVGGEHYAARTTLSEGKGFDRNPRGNAYVPYDSKLPYVYHYGAFFGGSKENMIGMCSVLRLWQERDQRINYEPPVNDESYINKFFHYEDHTVIPIEKFEFIISDKGGLKATRNPRLKIDHHIKTIKLNKDVLWDLKDDKIIIQ